MNVLLTLVPSVALLLGAGDAAKDAEKIQGTWTVADVERGGSKMPESLRTKMQVIIKDGSMAIVVDKDDPKTKGEEAKLELDPSTKPKSLQMTSPDKDKPTVRGIYELEGDTLKMCWRMNGGARPSAFGTVPQSDLILFVLNRVTTK